MVGFSSPFFSPFQRHVLFYSAFCLSCNHFKVHPMNSGVPEHGLSAARVLPTGAGND